MLHRAYGQVLWLLWVVLTGMVFGACSAKARHGPGAVSVASGPEASARIDRTGGTITLTDGPAKGARIEIPPNALRSAVTITMRAEQASPELPEGIAPAGPAVIFGPEGQTFERPVTVILPATLNAKEMYTRPLGSTEWTQIPGAHYDLARGAMVAQVTHFSVDLAGEYRNQSPQFLDYVRNELIWRIEKVPPAATQTVGPADIQMGAAYYNIVDDQNRPMHAAKIIQQNWNEDASAPPGGDFVAVYHSWNGDTKQHSAHLAIATVDEMRKGIWRYRRTIADNAMYPTIRHTGNDYIVVWEDQSLWKGETSPRRLLGENYIDWQHLVEGNKEQLGTSRVLSNIAGNVSESNVITEICGVGTPSLYYPGPSGSETAIVLFHFRESFRSGFSTNCHFDRIGIAKYEFTTRTALEPLHDLNNAILAQNILQGSGGEGLEAINVRHADTPVKFSLHEPDEGQWYSSLFSIVEAQYGTNIHSDNGKNAKVDFDKGIRPFLYDHTTKKAEYLNIHTANGSYSIGAPSIEKIDYNTSPRQRGLIVSVYVYGPGELGEVGQLIYYTRLLAGSY